MLKVDRRGHSHTGLSRHDYCACTRQYINGSTMFSDLQNQWITHTGRRARKQTQNERTDWQFQTRRIYVGGRFISHYCFISNKPLEFIWWRQIIKRLVKLNSETIAAWFIPALPSWEPINPFYYGPYRRLLSIRQKDSECEWIGHSVNISEFHFYRPTTSTEQSSATGTSTTCSVEVSGECE